MPACSIGFNVDNLDLAYERRGGVEFVMAPTSRPSEGQTHSCCRSGRIYDFIR
jgi:hypothetical protein